MAQPRSVLDAEGLRLEHVRFIEDSHQLVLVYEDGSYSAIRVDDFKPSWPRMNDDLDVIGLGDDLVTLGFRTMAEHEQFRAGYEKVREKQERYAAAVRADEERARFERLRDKLKREPEEWEQERIPRLLRANGSLEWLAQNAWCVITGQCDEGDREPYTAENWLKEYDDYLREYTDRHQHHQDDPAAADGGDSDVDRS